ncbi:MAG TPA: cytochrome c peroxidase [Anaerolineales bacterium]|nr:cytochrome c peroxidase [Anaerolineales bacterium]
MLDTSARPFFARLAHRRAPLTAVLVFGLTLVSALGACNSETVAVAENRELRTALVRQGVGPYPVAPQPPAAQVALGQALFFDPELSGNRDVACATCHLPSQATGDGLSLPIGTGGAGLGPDRQADPTRPRVARNAPDVLFRGSSAWITVFWDGRVWGATGPGYMATADAYLPHDLENILAAQALFPLTAREEMRGQVGDTDVFGRPNELAAIDDVDLHAIWAAVVDRVTAFPDYRALLTEAYPAVAPEQVTIAHIANALGAFEVSIGNSPASPWDRYLGGDDDALTDAARRGALLFYGAGGCSSCHSGALLSDQLYHNLAVPQIAPGKVPVQPLDPGRAMVTGAPEDMFAFRTPPLRNVAVTGPWMHNGAYTTLEGAVRHHLDPATALKTYDVEQLSPELRAAVVTDSASAGGILRAAAVLKTVDPLVKAPRSLTEAQVDDLLAFLEALTDPATADLAALVPESVPSGLPVVGP